MYGLKGCLYFCSFTKMDYFNHGLLEGVKAFMGNARITGGNKMSHFKALEDFFKNVKYMAKT